MSELNELDILDMIESVSSLNEKLLLLRGATFSVRMQELLDAALNFKRKFFIKKFDFCQTSANTLAKDRHREFIELLQLLEGQTARGDAAKTAVESFMTLCTDQQQKWYSRVIRKDLKSGFSESLANRAGFLIPVFDVMLAKDGKQCKQLHKLVSAGGFVSKKFDGYRCLAVIENGDVTLYSRNGVVYENFPSIENSLSKLLPLGKYVLDGEIMSNDFQSMQKTAFSEDTTVGDVKYFIFDKVDYQEWISSTFKKNKSDRISDLKLLNLKADNIEVVDHIKVNSLQEIMDLEIKFVQEGYEGAMFLPDIPYYLGKSSNKMLKFKTMLTQDVTVLSVYKGEPDSKLKDTMGGFTVMQEDGIQCDCGSGFSDEDRDYIWTNKDEFVGRIFEAAYQEIGSNGKMRFPVFKRWRDNTKNKGKKI